MIVRTPEDLAAAEALRLQEARRLDPLTPDRLEALNAINELHMKAQELTSLADKLRAHFGFGERSQDLADEPNLWTIGPDEADFAAHVVGVDPRGVFVVDWPALRESIAAEEREECAFLFEGVALGLEVVGSQSAPAVREVLRLLKGRGA